MGGIKNALGGKKSVAQNDAQPADESKVTKPVSARARAIEESVKQTNDQWLSSAGVEGGPKKEVYLEEDIPLGSILLDKQNHRTKHINVAKPTQNVLPEDHHDYQKNQDLINNLIEFAEHLKNEPLRQQPGVYRSNGKVYMAYGHRRFLALLIAYGPKFVYRFKVYPSKPMDLAKARFQENVQRVDVPLSDKLLDFKDAQGEAINILTQQNESISNKVVSSRLGINTASYSVFDRALKKDFIARMVEEGVIQEYRALRSIISLETESEVRKKLGLSETSKVKKKVSRGRPKKYVQFPKITNTKVMKSIINGRLSEFDWKDEDFESYDTITAKINECIEKLAEQ